MLIVELEVEALAKWQVRSELVSRFVPASGGAAVENLTLRERGEREAVDSKDARLGDCDSAESIVFAP